MPNVQQCPKCHSKNVAKIEYGYIRIDDDVEKLLKSGKIVLGGCVITGNDPKWQCNDCQQMWGKRAGR